jgi:hypothetical protein
VARSRLAPVRRVGRAAAPGATLLLRASGDALPGLDWPQIQCRKEVTVLLRDLFVHPRALAGPAQDPRIPVSVAADALTGNVEYVDAGYHIVG